MNDTSTCTKAQTTAHLATIESFLARHFIDTQAAGLTWRTRAYILASLSGAVGGDNAPEDAVEIVNEARQIVLDAEANDWRVDWLLAKAVVHLMVRGVLPIRARFLSRVTPDVHLVEHIEHGRLVSIDAIAPLLARFNVGSPDELEVRARGRFLSYLAPTLYGVDVTGEGGYWSAEVFDQVSGEGAEKGAV